MKTIYDLTPEERKQAKPEGIRFLIENDKQRVQNPFLPKYMMREIQKELIFLEDLLKEVE